MAGYSSHHLLYGPIEVICGPMFSGKTEELIRRIKRVQMARQKAQIFKPSIDNRYHRDNAVSHSGTEIQAKAINEPFELFNYLFDSTRVVAIDEVQFFSDDIIKVVCKLAKRGIRVICAGLDQDYKGCSFGPIPELLALADRVEKLAAICTVCGADATKTYRKTAIENDDEFLVGEKNIYEARCRDHFDIVEFKDDLPNLSLPLDFGNNEEVVSKDKEA